MTALNAWVLSEACAQAVRWESNLQVAVNCSVFQLRKHEAARAAAAALEASGLNPDRLSVEVTESTMGDDGAVADLRAMGRLGVQITVDDMASDWSIMRKLADLAVSTMKIDGSLVERLKQSDTENRARVETLIDISHSLGLCVVAEWVETEEQVSILRELDADVGQGYYFSPPLSAEEALELSAIDPPAAYPLVAVHGAGSATEAESPAEQWSQEPESHTEQWSREPESPGEPEDRTSGMPDRARFEELAEILGRIDDHLGRLTESLASLSEPPRYGF
jgi:EAL domain-containing protein (putative c-di-GMP-specific phosphodiesterase class I)